MDNGVWVYEQVCDEICHISFKELSIKYGDDSYLSINMYYESCEIFIHYKREETDKEKNKRLQKEERNEKSRIKRLEKRAQKIIEDKELMDIVKSRIQNT